jgi:hypothetical protein
MPQERLSIIGLNKRNAIVLRQKLSRGQLEARLANMPPYLIGMEACVGAHHLSRKHLFRAMTSTNPGTGGCGERAQE